MGLRAGGRTGASRGAPEGPGSGGGAQGGSIHSGCIAAVHNVPLSVLIRPLPSVLDPAKVQSLVDTIRVPDPGLQGWTALPWRAHRLALDASTVKYSGKQPPPLPSGSRPIPNARVTWAEGPLMPC
ncbi:sulfiredoxin-1 isoform X3 [Urocitellus parryii]|uniref:sulfiredoxin-1 isoform X3 n=1 Tax=Urocitellus parryii TaxID=9999 RepID=UPI000E55B6EC|nr:sulfiredoxin-1 isoform X3 [Urocitellus parryii]XP_026257856.1 sulfiredoxin-1 isoform X3 [Urocitellus parryii]